MRARQSRKEFFVSCFRINLITCPGDNPNCFRIASKVVRSSQAIWITRSSCSRVSFCVAKVTAPMCAQVHRDNRLKTFAITMERLIFAVALVSRSHPFCRRLRFLGSCFVAVVFLVLIFGSLGIPRGLVRVSQEARLGSCGDLLFCCARQSRGYGWGGAKLCNDACQLLPATCKFTVAGQVQPVVSGGQC